jgi:hypothetical protein
MRRLTRQPVIIFLAIVILSIACKAFAPEAIPPLQDTPTISQTAEVALEETATPTGAEIITTDIPYQTEIPPPTSSPLPSIPTEVPVSTSTSLPTATPSPTPTPTDTATSTPSATPVRLLRSLDFSDIGTKVLDLQKGPGPAIVRAIHTGQGDFTITNFDADNDRIAELVDETGNYSGILPLDFEENGTVETRRIIVDADGAWELHIQPLSSARTLNVPGSIIGDGSEVLILQGATPGRMTLDASQTSDKLILRAYRLEPDFRFLETLVDVDAPLSGIFMAPNNCALLTIEATGFWRLEISS